MTISENSGIPWNTNKNTIEDIKKNNILTVYPYGENSYNLLKDQQTKTMNEYSFKHSMNSIIYLDKKDEQQIKKINTDRQKLLYYDSNFPVNLNGDDNSLILTNNGLTYILKLIESHEKFINATYLNLHHGDTIDTPINTPINTDNIDDKRKEAIRRRRAMQNKIGNNPNGGKKNLSINKEMNKINTKTGGYRYSALGMKGLTIDLSGLKTKKTRRVKKKGKTAKNKKGSRKNKKGSRKNKKRGKTYRNKK